MAINRGSDTIKISFSVDIAEHQMIISLLLIVPCYCMSSGASFIIMSDSKN